MTSSVLRALRVARGAVFTALLVGLIVVIVVSRAWAVLAVVLALGVGVPVLEVRDRRAARDAVRRRRGGD
jgi:hypothetical protein